MYKYLVTFFLFATPIWAQQVDTRSYINVTGSASIALEPDQADISLGVEITDPDAKTAMNLAAERVNQMMGVLEEAGIDKADLQTRNLNVSNRPTYDDKGQLTSNDFVVTNQLNVHVRDLATIPDLLGKLTDAGMNQVSGISFSSSQKDAVTDQALQSAMEQARRRADLVAAASGMRVVNANSISIDYDEPQPVFMAAAAFETADAKMDAPPMPVSGGTVDVKARASVQYIMEPAQ